MKRIFCMLGLLMLACLPISGYAAIYADAIVTFQDGIPGNPITRANLDKSTYADAAMGRWCAEEQNNFGCSDPLQASYIVSAANTFPVPVVVNGFTYFVSSWTQAFQEYLNPASQCTGAQTPVLSCAGPGTSSVFTLAQLRSCVAKSSPYQNCLRSGYGLGGGTEDVKVTLPSGVVGPAGLSMGVLFKFDLSTATKYNNYPMFNIWSPEADQSFCAFNVRIDGDPRKPYVRTESSLYGGQSIYGTTAVNLTNGAESYASLLYQPGPISASSVPPNDMCTASKTPWKCCTAFGLGKCGLCQINVYETQNWTLIRTTFGPLDKYLPNEIKIGKPGAGYGVYSGGYVQIQAIFLDWSTVEFPLGPEY